MSNPSRLTRLVLAGLALGWIAVALPALAQSRRRSQVKFTMPRLSYDRGAPSKRGDGASRNQFCTAASGPIALTPQYSEAILLDDGTPKFDPQGQLQQKHFALTQTSQARPTFALYMPLAKQDVADLKLNLLVLDAVGNEVYDLPVAAPSRSGIITFQPDADQFALEKGQRYDWMIEVEVACAEDDLNTPKYETLSGQIERRALFQGETLTSAETFAEIAAERGFWPDAMATVADLHRQDRSDPQYIDDWAALLEGVGLSQLVTAQLLGNTQLLSSKLSPSLSQASPPLSSAQLQANQLPPEASTAKGASQSNQPRLFPVR